jgi:primosomal protein N' (replication factor Y) (superfamily II helicase)
VSDPSPPTAPALPVARVAVDISLAHLDRPFDYRVSAEQDAAAVPGARVRVRFAGQLRDGFVLERLPGTEHEGGLSPLHKVVSAEPVLTAEVATLIRRVADHYAGCFADVLRLAMPPRHAATEKVAPGPPVEPDDHLGSGPGPFGDYPHGSELLAALAAGGSPRACWQLTPSADPSGDWAAGLALAAQATARSGRGAVLVVPDQRDLNRLAQACARVLGPAAFVSLSADLGPATRYRAFLRALRGEVRVVIGNRAAAFAPVPDLGLVALFDDGDDLLTEPRAPYPHARTVLALRAATAGAAVLFGGYARTAEVQQLVDRGWLRELTADRPTLRHTAPPITVTADSDLALQRDPHARAARLPHQVFELIRGSLPQGPVLIQVPRGGYLVALVCSDCREPARCAQCGGPLRTIGGDGVLHCGWCGRPDANWICPICGSRRMRAPKVGAARTAEELGKAFPRTPVRQSHGGRVLPEVEDTPALVVATPGAEPAASGGYAGAVLLDTEVLLLRADLRAGEEALRRWLNAAALVRPGNDGGSVIAAGESSDRALQALVRLDPAGFARRELAERTEARFPPAVKMITVEGDAGAVAEFAELLRPPQPTECLGPVDLPPAPGEAARGRRPETGREEVRRQRLTLRAPLGVGARLVRAVQDVTALRSARKSDGALRIRVDPQEVS